MRSFYTVLLVIFLTLIAFAVGYVSGYRFGYIQALADKANNIEPEWMLVEQANKEVIWKRNNNYKGSNK